MLFTLRNSILERFGKKMNLMIGILSISMLTNVVLSLGLILSIGHDRIILVPPSFSQNTWIGNDELSDDYLARISTFLANLRFNQTPASASYQQTLLLRYVHPSFYLKLKQQLHNESEQYKKQQITTGFYPINVKIDAKNFMAILTGDMITSVGLTPLPSRQVTYFIRFRYENGRLWLASIAEGNQHDVN